VQIIALSMMLQLFTLATPFFMQLVIDEVVVNRDLGLLRAAEGVGGRLRTADADRSGVTALRSLIIVNIGAQLNIQMANNLFRHLIRLPLSYFREVPRRRHRFPLRLDGQDQETADQRDHFGDRRRGHVHRHAGDDVRLQSAARHERQGVERPAAPRHRSNRAK